MVHYSRVATVVVDVPPAEHETELVFWQAASGQALTRSDRYPEYHAAALQGQDFSLLVQRLDDGHARVHLDIHTDDLEAEVARLERLGARRVRQIHSWWVMRDPAGLPFCVIPQPSGSLNGDNARRWE